MACSMAAKFLLSRAADGQRVAPLAQTVVIEHTDIGRDALEVLPAFGGDTHPLSRDTKTLDCFGRAELRHRHRARRSSGDAAHQPAVTVPKSGFEVLWHAHDGGIVHGDDLLMLQKRPGQAEAEQQSGTRAPGQLELFPQVALKPAQGLDHHMPEDRQRRAARH